MFVNFNYKIAQYYCILLFIYKCLEQVIVMNIMTIRLTLWQQNGWINAELEELFPVGDVMPVGGRLLFIFMVGVELEAPIAGKPRCPCTVLSDEYALFSILSSSAEPKTTSSLPSS